MPGKISGFFGFLTYTFQNNLNVFVLKTIKLLIETKKKSRKHRQKKKHRRKKIGGKK